MPKVREVAAVRLKLRPNDDSFYDFFTKAAENLVRGTELLTELAMPKADVQSVSERLVEVEHDNDALTHELYNRINSSFVTPFDREDIYRLGSQLDDVMDHLEAVGSLLYLYGLSSLPSLNTMKGLKDYWVECNRLENEGDRAYRMLLVRLFSGEYDALTVMKMKEVADELEAACDAFEHVANTVETITVKES